MRYIDQTAAAGEQIIGEASFSWLCLAFAMAPFWIGLTIVFIAFEFLTHSGLLDGHVSPQVLDYGLVVILAVGVIRYLMVALPWLNMEIVATTHRIVYSHGILSRHAEEVAINRLEGVNLNQSFLGRMFNFGSLTIVGVGLEAIVLPPISSPLQFRRVVQEAVNQSQSRDASFMGDPRR